MDNSKNNIWKVGVLVGVLLSIFLLVISIKELKAIGYVGKDVPATNVISVTGTGDSVAIPDVATFTFGVTENAKSVEQAQTAATTKINAALKALKDNGIEDKDIQTLSYSINPHYEYDATGNLCASYSVSKIPCRPGTSVLTGYDVTQDIQVKVHDLSKAGSLFQTIGSLNVQNVNGLSFSINDIDKVKAKARDIAIQNAKDKAQTLAKQLGVSLLRITSFYDQSDEGIPYYAKSSMGMGGDSMSAQALSIPAPSVPTGEQKITSRVTISYEIR